MLNEKSKPEKSRIKIAFDLYEHVFIRYKNNTADQSNKHPVGDPGRVEHTLNDNDKAHLELLRANVDVEIALSNAELAKTLNNFTCLVVVFTAIAAISAFAQAFPILKCLFTYCP